MENYFIPSPSGGTVDISKLMDEATTLKHNILTDVVKRKYIIPIDNDMTPEEAEIFTKKVKDMLSKPLINPETGEIDLNHFKYREVDIGQDFWLGTPASEPEYEIVFHKKDSLLQRIKNTIKYVRIKLGL